jgi:hypothetical protein
MEFHSNRGDRNPFRKEYSEGGNALLSGKPRIPPFSSPNYNEKSPEVISWLKGYDDAKEGILNRKKEEKKTATETGKGN